MKAAGADHKADTDLDRGPRASERERLCIATRTVRPLDDLVRFVVGPDGEVAADIKGKLPGRGTWVTASKATLEEAIKRRIFARGFKRDVRVPADLAVRTEKLLEGALLDALAIARKSGRVATGFAKVEDALAHEAVAALLHAAEAAPQGAQKLDAVAAHRAGKPVVVIGVLTGAQLDLALSRPNVVHAALLAGPASDTFLSRWRRLERFRCGGPGDRAIGPAGLPRIEPAMEYG